jgi:hypothetical protein
MNLHGVTIGFLLFFIGQAMIWYQTNAQFLWQWPKEHPFIMSLCGVPISYVLIIATAYVVQGFEGLLWPGRLLGFGSGMVVMVILTWIVMGEGITTKTLVSLTLALLLVLIQILWK